MSLSSEQKGLLSHLLLRLSVRPTSKGRAKQKEKQNKNENFIVIGQFHRSVIVID